MHLPLLPTRFLIAQCQSGYPLVHTKPEDTRKDQNTCLLRFSHYKIIIHGYQHSNFDPFNFHYSPLGNSAIVTAIPTWSHSSGVKRGPSSPCKPAYNIKHQNMLLSQFLYYWIIIKWTQHENFHCLSLFAIGKHCTCPCNTHSAFTRLVPTLMPSFQQKPADAVKLKTTYTYKKKWVHMKTSTIIHYSGPNQGKTSSR